MCSLSVSLCSCWFLYVWVCTHALCVWMCLGWGESYLHILEYTECVAQIMGIDIHETVENINIWDDLPIDQVLQQDSFVNFISLPAKRIAKMLQNM